MPGIKGTMKEFSEGTLHSGSKHGPKVKSRAQAIAIGLSEERKEGHKVPKAKHHSFASSNEPFGAVSGGLPVAHAEPEGHKVSGGRGKKGDGAGKHAHDVATNHMSHSEHKAPHHPEGKHPMAHPSTHHPNEHGAGPSGYPGKIMEMDHDGGTLVGGNYSQSMHEPAVLKTPNGQGFTAGHTGISAGMGSGSHGYGHTSSQRDGVHRLSGHSGAHRIGQRKK